MTQEEKLLLFKDLCARLPYHLILNWKFIDNSSKDEELKELSDLYIWWITKAQDCEVRPYLRPMSSMTKEEDKKYIKIIVKSQDCSLENSESATTMVNDWLLSKGFDVRGLIKKGLALEAPEEMYK